MKKTVERLTTIKGIVLPVNWDENGKVINVAIFTHDEDEFLVNSDMKGKKLLTQIHKELEVSGIVKAGETKKIIIVKEIHDL